MIGSIIVAIFFNLITILILTNNVLTARCNGFKLTSIKAIGIIASFFGAYFLISPISNIMLKLEWFSSFINKIGISNLTINGFIFLLSFLIFYLIVYLICNLIKHIVINKA